MRGWDREGVGCEVFSRELKGAVGGTGEIGHVHELMLMLCAAAAAALAE